MAGTWTAQILWANGRGHVQTAPDTPGPYTGTVTFQASGQNFTTSPASAPVTIAPRSSVSVPPQHRPPPGSRRCPRVGAVHGAERARELGADRPAYPHPVGRWLVQRHTDQFGISRCRADQDVLRGRAPG